MEENQIEAAERLRRDAHGPTSPASWIETADQFYYCSAAIPSAGELKADT
jgi:hypothetical protein